MEREREAAAAAQVPRPIRRRTYVRREHDIAHQRLFNDYFAKKPRWGPTVFHRRFRMRRDLFLRIIQTLEALDEYFQYWEDGVGRSGLTSLQKCMFALRKLAYGTTTDMFDEYLHVGETTGRECLMNFCRGVAEAYSDIYLRRPAAEDFQALMHMHEMAHGFPGMLWSIDCMHWEWKNCPTAWRGQFTSAYKGSHPTMILETIADHRLWIWHAYFVVAGSNNDNNVLNSSNLLADQCRGPGPAIEFTANRRQYHMGYYLAYGIYPRWLVFVKTISYPIGDRRVLFAARQEAARKDVGDDECGSSSSTATPPVARGLPMGFNEVIARQTSMRSQQDHAQLMNDMIEDVWKRNHH
ncbi:uncharacterized protein LOC125189932 [Salvia hispanica]|uniref:uncharacterized protein LOC125189932 n=1 Tax=Salvia hispanica TaxID=49212 RepID=UPI002009163C|nr:uncharacterized protein LOC125189932 [Salvia hispanica]